jgi:hypothetical protein
VTVLKPFIFYAFRVHYFFDCLKSKLCIAIAPQIFQKVFFFTSWGSFPFQKRKKVFMKNLPGASNINHINRSIIREHIDVGRTVYNVNR